eukprot:1329976-Pyramimonas_sp.AAC.1
MINHHARTLGAGEIRAARGRDSDAQRLVMPRQPHRARFDVAISHEQLREPSARTNPATPR